MIMKPKPDNRQDNAEKLEQMVENTRENMEAAQETADNLDLKEEDRQAIKEKNQRREESIQSFQAEIADEKGDRERGDY
ncbi:small acid-soluble spore protein Tlp [Alteribacter lacisalsi]|uniref:Small, acid-soluble spore protein Tlp n=1 Tax=Alteribacter lacisalsi TaxID=2045244 RepID=A0A2W0HAG5_9BACI|nr:small acid-soluble spore protein Tlp [Alteribacter lacisalsi]PYZ98147.1 small acid-soluble spore protein Tlp [Alteribacter lacisalsi]